jgi:hypothetical protein
MNTTNKIVLCACAFGILAWGATWILAVRYIPDWPQRGQFGDLFGSVNALFGGLAFIGVIWALLLQREQLGIQETELKQNTAQLKEQAEALTNQVGVASTAARLETLPFLIAEHEKRLNVIDPDRFSARRLEVLSWVELGQLGDNIGVEVATMQAKLTKDPSAQIKTSISQFQHLGSQDQLAILRRLETSLIMLTKYRQDQEMLYNILKKFDIPMLSQNEEVALRSMIFRDLGITGISELTEEVLAKKRPPQPPS